MTAELDFTDPDFVADPYPALADLRRRGPVQWHGPSGTWLATTHAAVTQTLRTRDLGRIWVDRQPAAQLEPFNVLHRNQMMEHEPPAHTRLRRLVASAFGRGHVERMRPRVEAIASELVGAFGGPRVDLVADYAEPLPVLVICELLGVPGSDRVLLRDWSQSIVRMYEHRVDEPTTAAAVSASRDFGAYVRELVAHRTRELERGRRGDDLVSDLVTERDGTGRLSEDELVASVVLLLNAGHEASVNAFGNGIHALLTHPDQLQRVTSGEVDAATAVEELLRFDAPLQLFERTATADVEVAGRPIRAGQRVAALMGSANRDEAAFHSADRLDVARTPNAHVGFGMGVHFCLGAPLARMELQIALRELLSRFPHLQLSQDAPRRPTFVLRGFERVDVVLG